MNRLTLIAAATVAALSAASCASRSDDDAAPAAATATPAPAAPQMATPPPAQEQGGVYSDDQLRAFIAASTEIDPITRTLSTATPEQQAQATVQIREILQRNGLNGDTYNAIAAQAQADATFAARINALRTPPASPAGTAEPPEPGSPEPTPANPQ